MQEATAGSLARPVRYPDNAGEPVYFYRMARPQLFRSKANMDSFRKIWLHSRLWIAVLGAAALGMGIWSFAPAPANAGVPGLYAQYPYYPYPPGYYPYYPPPRTYPPAPAMHLNRVMRLRRAGQEATSPDN